MLERPALNPLEPSDDVQKFGQDGLAQEVPPNEADAHGVSDMQLAVEGMLDPRSKEFQDAVKLTPATMAHYRTGGKWFPAEHLLYLSSILASEITQGDARIIVELPPRHGKSELCSVHTPTWFLEHFPWAQVILATYAADLATGFGRRVRDSFLLDNGAFLNTRIRDDVQRTDYFQSTEGGGMASVGIGGPITGRGAHLLLVDDYIKNWAEASSDLVLESIWNWFLTTAYTRLEPGGSCVILATRWTLNDLIGRLKEQDKTAMWKVIRLPAIAEANDPLNRQPGEALWTARYPIEKLLQIQSILGPFIFDAMYQQDPKEVSDSKADTDQLLEVDEIPNPQLLRWVRSWDFAASDAKKKKSDWSVGSLIGTNGRPGSPIATTYIADMVRGKWKPAELERTVRQTAESDGTNIPIVIEQEPGSSGKIAAEHIANNVLRGFNVTINPSGGVNKWIRNQPYIAAVTHGRIRQKKAAWNQVHKGELKVFPDGKNDDTVDSVGQGYNYLHQRLVLVPTWGRPSAQSTGVVRGGLPSVVRGATWGRRAVH